MSVYPVTFAFYFISSMNEPKKVIFKLKLYILVCILIYDN